jgi:curved DNA-binding protein CbpA
MAVKQAYDVLSDAQRRREYDAAHSTRGFGFFRDVDPEAEAAAAAAAAEAAGGPGRAAGGRGVNPWDLHRWARVGWGGGGCVGMCATGRAPRSANSKQSTPSPPSSHPSSPPPKKTTTRRIWEEETARERRAGKGQGADEDEDDGEADRNADPADFLERLGRVMGGPGLGGSLADYQSGRLDPFGTSSSQAWFRRVEQQRAAPFPGRPGGGYGRGLGDEGLGGGANPEWSAPRRRGDDDDSGFDGWRPPGQRPEWGRRGPADDDDEEGWGKGGGGGGRPLKGDDFRRGGGGGGGFRGW